MSSAELKFFKKLVSLGFTDEGTYEQGIEGGEGVRQAISEEEHPRQRE